MEKLLELTAKKFDVQTHISYRGKQKNIEEREVGNGGQICYFRI